MTEPTPAAAQHDVLDAAIGMRARIEALAPAIEEARRLPPELVEEFRHAGFFRMLVPDFVSPSVSDPITAARVVEEVARADGSAGWCVMIATQSNGFAGFLSDEAIEEVWGGGGIVAGTARPIGRAVPQADGEGYRVSGRWPFASGSSHADWFSAECIVYDGDEPRRRPDGEPVTRLTFVPRDEVKLHDTWFTTGLRGTASNDFSIDDAFVPARLGFEVGADMPQRDELLYRAPALVFMNHGSHALGMARATVEDARGLIGEKVGWGGVPLAEVPRVQAVLAEASVLVDSARTHLYDAANRLVATLEAGASDEEAALLRARTRLATSHAASASVRAVDLLHDLLATSAIFSKHPIERRFRDMHTAAAHVMIGPLTYEAAGRVELGRDPEFPFF